MEELKRQAAALYNAVTLLTDSVARLEVRMGRHERDKRWLVAALLVLVALLALVGFNSYQTNRAIANDAQLRQEVLCPFFALVVGSYNPESRPEGEARRKYEEAFVSMTESYRRLRCADTDPVVPGSRR